jgi:hypothetical protein
MTQINYTQNTFTKGIIDENLSARADTNFLIQGANDIVNMSITPQGTIEGRNGIVANKVEASLLNKAIDITEKQQIENISNYTIYNNNNFIIVAFSIKFSNILCIKRSNDKGSSWVSENIDIGALIEDIKITSNNNGKCVIAVSSTGSQNNFIKIYSLENYNVNWILIQTIFIEKFGKVLYSFDYINNNYILVYSIFIGGITKFKLLKTDLVNWNNVLEFLSDGIVYNVTKSNIEHKLFILCFINTAPVITNIGKLKIINIDDFSMVNYNYDFYNTNIPTNVNFFIRCNNENNYFLTVIETDFNWKLVENKIINNQITQSVIKEIDKTSKNIVALEYNLFYNKFIIGYSDSTNEITINNEYTGVTTFNSIVPTKYISINSLGEIFYSSDYNENNKIIYKKYFSLLGFEPLEITQQKNISVDDNLYSVIIYQNIITKERYLQLYNINNGNYIAYKFNLSYNNSLTNENFNIISLIKLTDTQLLFTTSLAWYVINIPKQTIEYNNDLRYFKITDEFRSRYGIQNYLFQATQPANPVEECNNNFTLATLDKDKIKTIIDMDTCIRFLIVNLEKNDKDGIIGINTRVKIYIDVPANNNVMLKAFWKANIYKYADINSFDNNNQTIFFCRGLYILTNDTANILNNWDKSAFSFEVNGIVIDGASVNNELLINYYNNQYGLNGSFDNGDIILFNNFNAYCYSNNGLVSFKPMYPSIMNRFQNRLVCNNTLLNNYQIYLSKIGDEYTFFATDIETASAFSFSLNGNERILQIETGKKFLISSINGNYIVSNPLNENLKPTNFNINKISNVIINKNIKPVEYDDKIFYIQNINNNIKFIVETDKIGATNEGIANISNMDIFKNATILDMLSCPNLNNNGSYLFILFIKNNKLQLSCCYSDKNQEILGWTKWESEIFNVNGKDLSLCKLIYHDNTLYISYQLNNNDNYILYFKLSKTELQDLNVLDVVVPVEQKVITTPISIIDPTIGNMIYKPYKLSNINVAIKNNKNNQPITIYCDDVAMNSKTNNIYELRDYLGNTGYLNKITFKVLSSDAKLELLGWQTVINYQGDTIK